MGSSEEEEQQTRTHAIPASLRLLAATLALALPILCGDSAGAASSPESDRLLFPRNFVRGFAEFELNPPHGERDLGRCNPNDVTYTGADDPCAAFTRYLLGGYLEFHPFGRKLGPLPLHRLFGFVEPKVFFGQNAPGLRYTASTEPVMLERTIGAGIELPGNFELRVVQHRPYWFGRYKTIFGFQDLGKDGPYGMHAGVSVRWYYGGWGRLRPSDKVNEPAVASRLLLPERFVRGFTEFGVNPPHNEVDVGRCRPYTARWGGAAAPCAAFGRYHLNGYVEVQPFGRSLGRVPLQRLFGFIEPKTFFGRNIPQVRYTASMEPILFERTLGVGFELSRSLEIRLQQHGNLWLGRNNEYLGFADMGPDGPYGQFTAISLRWYYGGWGRHRR